jgi:hypothetical protein
LFVAALHIAILAAPLHALLSRERPPGPALILTSATLIGGLPVPLLFRAGVQDFMLFSLLGLIGGVGFCTVTGWTGRT